MKRSNLKLFFLFYLSIGGFISSSIYAGTPLSWDACIQLTAKNNADLLAAQFNREASQDLLTGSKSGFYPSVTGSVTYTKAGTTASDSNSTRAAATTSSAGLSANENLFAGFQDQGKIDQANANLEASTQALQITKAKVSVDLTSAFEGLTYANASMKLTDEILKRRQENLRLVDLRFQSGRENKGSLYLSQAYLAQAKLEDLQAKNAKRSSQVNLAKVIGLDPEDPTSSSSGFSSAALDIEIQGSVPIHEPPSSAPGFELLAIATPDFRQTEAQERASEAAVTQSRSNFYPSLNLTGSIDRQMPGFMGDAGDSSRRWSVGLGLSFPLFSGFKDSSNLKAALANQSTASAQKLGQLRQIRAKLESAFSAWVEAVEKLKVDESFRRASIVRADIARSRYNTGLMTFEDWDTVENELISRQKTYLQSERDRTLAESAWDQAQGKGVIP